jgi:hypothetical protein
VDKSKTFSTARGNNSAAARKAYARQPNQSRDKDRLSESVEDKAGRNRALPGMRRAARAKLKKLLPGPFGKGFGWKSVKARGPVSAFQAVRRYYGHDSH